MGKWSVAQWSLLVIAVVHFVTGGVMVGLAAIQIRMDGGWRASLGDLLPTRVRTVEKAGDR